jgi:20S proteasome alpha/beta subunit
MKHNKPYLPNRLRYDMTLIIGAKCKDGVVLVADKKIVEGTDITSGEKINILPLGIVVAGAGTGEVIDKFNERIPFVLDERKRLNYEELREKSPDVNIDDVPFYFRPYEFLEDCEGLIFQLFEKYKRQIQVLVAGSNIGEAELNYIDSEGFLSSKRRTYMSIGSGSAYANFLLKKLWEEKKGDFTMNEMAKISKFIINLVENIKIDRFVGNGVQIVFVPNLPNNYEKLSDQEKLKYSPHEEYIISDDNLLISEFYKFLLDIPKKLKGQTTFSS